MQHDAVASAGMCHASAAPDTTYRSLLAHLMLLRMVLAGGYALMQSHPGMYQRLLSHAPDAVPLPMLLLLSLWVLQVAMR